jgi:hypothetical protein
MRPAVAQDRRIARSSPVSLNRRRARRWDDKPGEKLARRFGIHPVDRGLAARHRDLADAGGHHLALDGERGELGVDQPPPRSR